MKNLNYIHESINAKAGLSHADCYGNPLHLDPKEANKQAKEEINCSMYSANSVQSDYAFLGIFGRSITKKERKLVESSYRKYCYNSSRFSGREYGQN